MAAAPQPLSEAGVSLEYKDNGTKLVARDVQPDGCRIRNRGGEALANFLKANRQIKALDLSESGISDNGIGHICLALRQTDQLEELVVSTIGSAGLEFLMGAVRRCGRLRSLRISVVDMATLVAASQNVKAEDFDTSAYVRQKKEGEEEEEEEAAAPEGDEDEDPEAGERKKLEKLRKILNAHDYNSEEEEALPTYARSNSPINPASKSRRSKIRKAKQAHDLSKAHDPSAKFHQLLEDFAEVVRHQENLLEVICVGDEVPDEIAHDIAHSVQEHQQERQRKLAARQERGARTAFDALKDQMEELRAHSDGGASGIATALSLPGEGLAEGGGSHMGIRAYVGRRLFSGLGEALFECQRFKSKENEAVSTWQGECAFLAMYLRKMAKEEAEKEQTK